jgi:hypothetical protein
MKLKDGEVKWLLVELPNGASLHALDEVTARARC